MSCKRCNRFYPSGWYQAPATYDMCGKVTCKGCGQLRRHGDGLGRGTCRNCHYGLLPGWSGSDGKCSYAGCKEPACFAYLPGGKRYACRKHGEKKLGKTFALEVTQ